LPASSVPARFVFLHEPPLTAGGKIDRVTLRVPIDDRESPGQSGVGPADGQGLQPSDGADEVLPTRLHHQLLAVWRRILAAPRLEITSDFFSAGGNSFLALRILSELEAVCGKRVSPDLLLRFPTVQSLALHVLNSLAEEVPQPVVRLNEDGPSVPIFYQHGDIYGGAYYCRELARGLGENQPLFVLTKVDLPPGADGVIAQISGHAREQVDVLREVQPDGPYILGGFCRGGLVALEMAHQLQASGEDVSMLILIDADLAPERFAVLPFARLLAILPMPDPMRGRLLLKYVYFLKRVSFHLHRDIRRAVPAYTRFFRYAFDRLIALMRSPRPGSREGETDREWRIKKERQDAVDAAYLWARVNYRHRPYAGKTILLLTEEWAAAGLKRRWRLHRRFDDLEARSIPGTNHVCVTAHVKQIANEIKMALRELNVD